MGRVRTQETEVFAPCLSLVAASCQVPSPGSFSVSVWGLQTVSTPFPAPAHHGLRARDKLETCPAPKDSRDGWCSGGNGQTGAGLNTEVWGPLPGRWALSPE